jgi:hypothetical protein
MTLRGMGHGLSTADKVKAIAVEHVRKRFAVEGPLKVDRMHFDDGFYRVYGHYAIEKESIRQFIVKLDRDGNVVEVTNNSSGCTLS